MDYEKYYRLGSDGSYTVHFPNKKGLSIEKIREIFSSYGQVLSVNISGDINGLRYVRYKTLDETLCCLKDLQNNNEIRILQHKDKINTNKRTDQKNSTAWQATKMDNLSQRKSNTSKQFNSNFTNNEKASTGEKLTYSRRNSDWDNKSDNVDNISNASFPSSRHSFKPNTITHKPQDKPTLVSDKKYLLNSIDKLSNCDQFNKEKTKYDLLTNSDTNIYENIADDEIPALISEPKIKQKGFDAMSDCSLPAGTKNASSKVIVTPLQEVIVANIHANYGVHYILHLFEEHNPISATIVKTISETDIRYCHVYFKTIQDTLAIEKQFDNFVLLGKNLIVLRKSQLIDEAMCK